MKKKFIMVLVLLIGLGLLTGCSEVEQAYINDQLETLKWPGTEDLTEIQLKATVEGDKIEMNMKMESKQEISNSLKNFKVVSKLSGSLKVNDELVGALSDISIIFDQDKMLIKVKDLLSILNTAKIDFNESKIDGLISSPEDYVVLDFMAMQESMLAADPYNSFSYNSAEYQKMMADPLSFTRDFLQGITANLNDFSTPMKKEGNTYTVLINNDNAPMLVKSLVASIINNIEGIIDIYPYPEEMKAEILSSLSTISKEEVLKEFNEEIMPGIENILGMGKFSISLNEQYNPNDYTKTMKMEMDYPNLAVEFSLDAKGKKVSQGLNIVLPEESKRINAEVLIQKLMTPDKNLVLDVETGQGMLMLYGEEPVEIKFDIQVYKDLEMLPARAVLEAFGENLVWQDDLHAAYISTPHGPVYLEGEILTVNGRDLLYIEPWEFIKVDYNLDWQYKEITISK